MTDSISVLRLNKFVAKSGVCNRKEAVELIKGGSIMVNGLILKEPFYEVQLTDVIVYKGKILVQKQEYVYILLNKPKDIGALENKTLRKPSIMELIKKLTDIEVSQLFPLEDESCGLTILTNDPELVIKYSDSTKVSKTVFEIELDQSIEIAELTELVALYSGDTIKLTSVSPIGGKDGFFFGVEIMSGTDKEIKNLFVNKGYQVQKIDRTFMNGLTKKDLKRGWSRLLTAQEVIFLKYF